MNILIDNIGFKRKEYSDIVQQFREYLQCLNANQAQSLRYHETRINKNGIEIILKCRSDVLNIYCHIVLKEEDKSRKLILKKKITKEKQEVYAFFINEIHKHQYIFRK